MRQKKAMPGTRLKSSLLLRGRLGSGFLSLASLCFIWLVSAVRQGFGQALTPDQLTFFEAKVRPVLAGRCFKCHSAEIEKPKGGLLLDTAEGLLKGGEDGPVVLPGEPEKSKLIEAIRYQNPELQMPPKGKITPAEITILVDWVNMGAPFP